MKNNEELFSIFQEEKRRREVCNKKSVRAAVESMRITTHTYIPTYVHSNNDPTPSDIKPGKDDVDPPATSNLVIVGPSQSPPSRLERRRKHYGNDGVTVCMRMDKRIPRVCTLLLVMFLRCNEGRRRGS